MRLYLKGLDVVALDSKALSDVYFPFVFLILSCFCRELLLLSLNPCVLALLRF